MPYGNGGEIMTILAILLTLLSLMVNFFITAGLTWVICWAFELTFSWKLAVGIFAILALIKGTFHITVKKN